MTATDLKECREALAARIEQNLPEPHWTDEIQLGFSRDEMLSLIAALRPTAAPDEMLAPYANIAEAIEKADWSGQSIGNKAILRAAIAAPRRPQQPADWRPIELTADELRVVEDLIELAYRSWRMCDDTEDRGAPDELIAARDSWDRLAAALDKLDDLPDDQPGYVMEAAAKARWALRRILPPDPAPPAEENGK